MIKSCWRGFLRRNPEGVRVCDESDSDAFVLEALIFIDQSHLLSGVPELAAVDKYREGYGVVCQSPLRGGAGDILQKGQRISSNPCVSRTHACTVWVQN